MLTAVNVTNGAGQTLTLSVFDPSNGLEVRDITGLDPVKAEITSSDIASQDGTDPQNARRSSRNIVMSVGLDPDWSYQTPEDLRDLLYGYLLPKANVTLDFIRDNSKPTLRIKGQVESFDAPLFTSDPVAAISIICFKPDFYELSSKVVNGTSVTGDTGTNFEYAGTADVGILFTYTATDEMNGFSIYHINPDGSQETLDFTYSLIAGDVITIDTRVNSKKVTITRDGVVTPILYAMSPQSSWIALQKGTNKIRVVDAIGGMSYSLSYVARYGGL